jgi:hypothetical protein
MGSLGSSDVLSTDVPVGLFIWKFLYLAQHKWVNSSFVRCRQDVYAYIREPVFFYVLVVRFA